MRKIPTLFVRDFGNDPRYVTREVTAGCEWVIDGEGVPTRKFDGTCVMYDGANWWARREVKPGKLPPPGFVELEHDNETGKTVGWEPAEQSAFARWLDEARRFMWQHATVSGTGVAPGTFELTGPRINGNPEIVKDHHVLVRHADADVLDVPRDYDGLAAWLRAHPYEGIVWHHEDGRMAKLKKRDFQAS